MALLKWWKFVRYNGRPSPDDPMGHVEGWAIMVRAWGQWRSTPFCKMRASLRYRIQVQERREIHKAMAENNPVAINQYWVGKCADAIIALSCDNLGHPNVTTEEVAEIIRAHVPTIVRFCGRCRAEQGHEAKP